MFGPEKIDPPSHRRHRVPLTETSKQIKLHASAPDSMHRREGNQHKYPSLFGVATTSEAALSRISDVRERDAFPSLLTSKIFSIDSSFETLRQRGMISKEQACAENIRFLKCRLL